MEHEVLPGTRWQHRNGNYYRVRMIVNEYANDPERYPVMVVYIDEKHRTWCKSVERFLAGMTPVSG
jgi:hypothetical protein